MRVRISGSLLSYVLQKCEVDASTGCWNWTGAVAKKAKRPIFTYQGRSALVYRELWKELNSFELKPKDFICHSCDNSLCCNPDHLFLSDAAGNNADAVKKGRNFARKNREGNLNALRKGLEIRRANPWMNPRGDQHSRRRHPELVKRGDEHWTKKRPDLIRRGSKVHNALFTEEQIASIRSDPRVARIIAGELGCCLSTINYIKRGKHYQSQTT